jgi:septum formation protein
MNQPHPRLILASQSPRRRELLTEAGYEFEVIAPSDSAESGKIPRESPSEMVLRLAKQKAADVAQRVDEGIVIACDTVVECEGRILGKPIDRHDAENMLRILRGKVQHVYSGLCLWRCPVNRSRQEVDVTKLKMEAITDRQLKEYLDSNAWQGKAGAFGYQDRHGWIQILAGSESNVVGLPLELLAKMLKHVEKG